MTTSQLILKMTGRQSEALRLFVSYDTILLILIWTKPLAALAVNQNSFLLNPPRIPEIIWSS